MEDNDKLEVLAREFDRCAQWIEPALTLSHGAYELDDVRTFCLQGRMQLWPGKKSAMVTEVSQYPRRLGCHATFYGGDPDELARTAEEVREWAKRHGADHFSCVGRPAWIRAADGAELVSTYTARSL